jgi:hypothetical protein
MYTRAAVDSALHKGALSEGQMTVNEERRKTGNGEFYPLPASFHPSSLN